MSFVTMKIMFWNVQGLRTSEENRDRVRDVNTIIYHYQPHVLVTCESPQSIALRDYTALQLTDIAEYQVYVKEHLRLSGVCIDLKQFTTNTSQSFIMIRSGLLNLALCHLDPYSSLVRISQLRELSEIEDLNVIMGDLNFSHSSLTSRLLGLVFQRIRDCTTSKEYRIIQSHWAHAVLPPTFPTKRAVRGFLYRWPTPFLGLDQIWCRNYQPVTVRRLNHTSIHHVSDHYPIMLTL